MPETRVYDQVSDKVVSWTKSDVSIPVSDMSADDFFRVADMSIQSRHVRILPVSAVVPHTKLQTLSLSV